MSLSAAEEEEDLQELCVPVTEKVVIQAGKRRRIESGTTAEQAAAILFPKGSTTIDCGAGELTAPEKGGRVVAERDGALIAMGSAKAEVPLPARRAAAAARITCDRTGVCARGCAGQSDGAATDAVAQGRPHQDQVGHGLRDHRHFKAAPSAE